MKNKEQKAEIVIRKWQLYNNIQLSTSEFLSLKRLILSLIKSNPPSKRKLKSRN